jgi:hypothetical protein
LSYSLPKMVTLNKMICHDDLMLPYVKAKNRIIYRHANIPVGSLAARHQAPPARKLRGVDLSCLARIPD